MKPIFIAAALCGTIFVNLPHLAAAEDALSPPAGSNLLLSARGDGVQSYVCTEKDKTFAWVFDGPSAALFNDSGRRIGVHEKGPIWTLDDGSGVTGELVARKDAPEAGAAPWLLLKVNAHVGTFGQLSGANYVRRIDTKGGAAPPDGCEAEHLGDIARIHYSAIYQFYGE
jgi:hypothetical protein